MTAKRFKKLIRALSTEYHIRYGVDINGLIKLCHENKPVLRNELGVNYQHAYDVLSKVLR